jgi:hypothetical protein
VIASVTACLSATDAKLIEPRRASQLAYSDASTSASSSPAAMELASNDFAPLSSLIMSATVDMMGK